MNLKKWKKNDANSYENKIDIFFSKEEKTYNMITFFLSCIYLLKKPPKFSGSFLDSS